MTGKRPVVNGNTNPRHRSKPRSVIPPAVREEKKIKEYVDIEEAREDAKEWPSQKKRL